MTTEYITAIGRRKTAVARVHLKSGTGQVLVNKRAIENYFPLELQRQAVIAPFKGTELEGKYDLLVNVRGGGLEAQAIATRMGLARALVKDNEAVQPILHKLGYLTRDSRKKERKKYGQKGARKRFQFSKR